MIKQFVTVNEEGNYNLLIPVNAMWGDVSVENISMFVHANSSDEDDEAYDGDLAVNWDASKLQNTGGGNMGQLIMRGDDDEVGKTMGRFYWDREFNGELAVALVAAGFTQETADDPSGSEWGMQDEGRASYDAESVADAVREAMRVTA